jgi:hypothetical protein
VTARLLPSGHATICAMSRRLCATLGVVTALILGYATPAHALTTWQYNNDLGGPSYTYFYDYPSRAAQVYGPVESIQPHSAPWSVTLTAGGGVSFASVYQYIQIAPVANGQHPECQFSAYVMAGTTSHFNIEVIDPTTWSWIAVSEWTNTYENYTWERGHTQWFLPTISQVVIRVSLLAPTSSTAGVHPTGVGHVDDFNMTCTY